MSVTVIPSAASNFPQTGTGRTRAQLLTDIATAAGGENDSDRLTRALVALRRAVRVYNVVLWKPCKTSQDITLAAADRDYALASDFAVPARAVLLDSNGKEAGVDPLELWDYSDWLEWYGDETVTSDPPTMLMFNNPHNDGIAYVYPMPLAPTTATYRKVRLYYYRRIVIPTGDNEVINIPQELEGGIEDLSIGYYLGYVEGVPTAAQPIQMALLHKERELEPRFRAFAGR